MKRHLFYIILILLSLLATIKICFFNLGMDEEYAVTLSYRMATGDRMFLELWEPHQTSGFLSAFLIKIYILATGGIEYLVLYLRIMGALLQAAISFFLYRTVKTHFSPGASFVAAIFFYNTLPKWLQTPEFSNMLVWFSVLAFLCFLRAYQGEKCRSLWLVLAGLSLSALVISYPSCLFAIPVFIIGMYQTDRHRFLKDAGVLMLTCLFSGLLYIGYFLSHMSFGQLLFGIQQMMTDGYHSQTIMERLTAFGWELVDLSRHLLLVSAIALLLHFALKRIGRTPGFLMLLICTAQIHQGIIWLMDGMYFQYPWIHYHILFAAGIFIILRNRKTQEVLPNKGKLLLWFGIIPGAAVWLSGLSITNAGISATGSYLMIGLLSTILLLGEFTGLETAKKKSKALNHLVFFTFLCILGTTLFGKGFMICESGGFKNNITFVRQKALSGPAKGIYYRYKEGYDYNNYAELVAEYVKDGESVLYVGHHTLRYLLGRQTISNFSTISTPTYDERLLEYWELYPERYPDVVIIDSEIYLQDIQKLLPLEEALVNWEGFEIYRIQKAPAGH